MENEIYCVLDNPDDYRNMNKQLHNCLNTTRDWYSNTFAFQISNIDGHLYCNVSFDTLHYDYGPFCLKKITVHIDLDDINDTNRIIRDIIDNRGFIKAIYIRYAFADIIYIPLSNKSDDEEAYEEVDDMRHVRIDNTSMVVELPRFNANAFKFGEAYFIKSKSVDKATKLVKYKRHCDDKVNDWIPENYDDIAKQLAYGVYALFKCISYQGTLITFFVACRNADSDTNKRCVELSIQINAMDDDIEITKLDIDAFDRKEKYDED